MRALLVILAACFCICCNHETPAPPRATVLPPDLGAFASHVTDPPLKAGQYYGPVRLYKVDVDYNNALLQLKPILESKGWSALPPTTEQGVIVAGFVHSSKGQYVLKDIKFDAPG